MGWQTYEPLADEHVITPKIALHVLYVTDNHTPELTMKPGSFITALIEAMCKADRANLGQLALAYPGYAEAVNVWRNKSDGLMRLRIRAREEGDDH